MEAGGIEPRPGRRPRRNSRARHSLRYKHFRRIFRLIRSSRKVPGKPLCDPKNRTVSGRSSEALRVRRGSVTENGGGCGGCYLQDVLPYGSE